MISSTGNIVAHESLAKRCVMEVTVSANRNNLHELICLTDDDNIMAVIKLDENNR